MPRPKLSRLTMGGPGHDGYAFQADTYCVGCGQERIKGLVESGSLDAKSEDEMRDSETVPQPIFFGEADHPVCCSDCNDHMYG